MSPEVDCDMRSSLMLLIQGSEPQTEDVITWSGFYGMYLIRRLFAGV